MPKEITEALQEIELLQQGKLPEERVKELKKLANDFDANLKKWQDENKLKK